MPAYKDTDEKVYQHTKMHACIACIRACIRACIHACTRACIRACIRACVRACIRACIRACTRACICACIAYEHKLHALPTLFQFTAASETRERRVHRHLLAYICTCCSICLPTQFTNTYSLTHAHVFFPQDLSRKSDAYIGKCKSNFVGTEFTLWDQGRNSQSQFPMKIAQ